MTDPLIPDSSLIAWAASRSEIRAASPDVCAQGAHPAAGRDGRPESQAREPGGPATRYLAILRRLVLGALAVWAVLAACPPSTALAGEVTWTGAGADNNWTTPGNWSGNQAPSAGDDLVFPGGVSKRTANNTFAGGTTFRSITFTGDKYAISGNRFALLNGITASNHSIFENTVAQQISLVASQTFAVTDSIAKLVLAGGVNMDIGSGVNQTATLVLAGPGTLEVGTLVGTFPSGGLIKQDTGRAVLLADSPNLLTDIRVEAGALVIETGGGLGAPSAGTLVRAGADLRIDLKGTQAATIAEPLTLFGAGQAGFGALIHVTGATTLSGRVELGSASTTIEVVGGERLTITGTLATASGGGAITGLKKFGLGTLVLAAPSTYAGTTTVTQGVLEVRHSQALGAPGTDPTVIGPDAAIHLVSLLNVPFVVDEPLTVEGNGPGESGALVGREGSTVWAGPITLAGTTTISVEQGRFLRLTGRIQGPGGLTKGGFGVMNLAGSSPNTYAGTTRVANGALFLEKPAGITAIATPIEILQDVPTVGATTLGLGQDNQIADTVQVTVRSSAQLDLGGHSDTIHNLVLTGGRVKTASGSTPGSPEGTLTVLADLTAEASPSTASIEGNLSLGGATRNILVADGSKSVDLEIGAAVTNGGINKVGAGTLRLSGTNTYTLPTSVTAGVLLVDGAQPSSPVSLTGGRLGGSGTTGPITATGGLLDPGGVSLNVNGTLTTAGVQLNASSTFGFSAGGPVAVDQDRIITSGPVTLGNAPLVTTLNFAPNIGTVFTMIQNGSTGPISGTFNGLAERATVTINGLAFRISYVGGDGNDVTLTRVDSVAECSPRPQVRLQSAPDGPGRLKVTVTAGTVGVANNRLQEIHFRPGTNAVVDINGQTGLAGDVLVPLPAQPTSVTFLVRKVTPGQASQLPFTVVDGCGPWQTFVGGGPSAF